MTADHVFLFSDIEGSSALWERYPDEMPSALARHDAVVRAAIAGQGGRVFKTGGDAFYAVMPSAPAAAEAAIAVHGALREVSTTVGPQIKVRVAIHLGTADERDGDFFGSPLNHLARILAAGHGGQTLVTAEVAAALDDRVAVHPLGGHRLRSIPVPVPLHEVTRPGEPPSGHPPRSLDRGHLTRLAGWPPLIGRTAERGRLVELLHDRAVRLVTVTGTGGVGKTHLVYAVVVERTHLLDRAVAVVECAGLRFGSELPGAIAASLDLVDRGDGGLLGQIQSVLRDERTLLVIDNVEHLREAATILGSLLGAVAGLEVIATSRAPLRVPGERELSIEPLPLDSGDGLGDAVELFLTSLPDARRDALAAPRHRDTIERIVRRMDGLPLAIQLAAGRARLLAPDELITRLDERTPAADGAGAEGRHTSLDEMVRWSYDLLLPRKRHLLLMLGAFGGGCTPAMLEQLYGRVDLDPLDALDDAESLVAKHLVRITAGRAGERLTMLETIRGFALTQLAADASRSDVVGRAHAAMYLDLVDPIGEDGSSMPRSRLFDVLDDERINLRQAGERLIADGDGLAAHVFTGRMASYWRQRGRISEARSLLNAAAGLDSKLRGNALFLAAAFAQAAGDLTSAVAGFRSAYEAHRVAGDRLAMADTMTLLVAAAAVTGEGIDVDTMVYDAVATYREFGDQGGEASVLNNRGMHRFWMNDLDGAGRDYRDALDICHRLEDAHQAALCLSNLAECLVAQARVVEAMNVGHAALAALRASGDVAGEASTLIYLGYAYRAKGDVAAAWERFADARRLLRDEPDTVSLGLAWLGAATAQPAADERSVRLIGGVDRYLERAGIRLAATYRLIRETSLDSARRKVGSETTARWLRDGRDMPLFTDEVAPSVAG